LIARVTEWVVPPWAVGFFFGNLELSMELWTVIAGLSGLMIKAAGKP
jgi:hypothetical protein